jgi:hypothetical protein
MRTYPFPMCYTNPIQRGRLEITAFGADSLYQAVTGATAGLYGIEWYQDDALQWKGEILGDLCTATEANTPNAFTFTAKDFTTLGSIDLPMTDERLPVIEVLSTVLAFTGYNLPIRTVTAWINSDMAEAAISCAGRSSKRVRLGSMRTEQVRIPISRFPLPMRSRF